MRRDGNTHTLISYEEATQLIYHQQAPLSLLLLEIPLAMLRLPSSLALHSRYGTAASKHSSTIERLSIFQYVSSVVPSLAHAAIGAAFVGGAGIGGVLGSSSHVGGFVGGERRTRRRREEEKKRKRQDHDHDLRRHNARLYFGDRYLPTSAATLTRV